MSGAYDVNPYSPLPLIPQGERPFKDSSEMFPEEKWDFGKLPLKILCLDREEVF